MYKRHVYVCPRITYSIFGISSWLPLLVLCHCQSIYRARGLRSDTHHNTHYRHQLCMDSMNPLPTGVLIHVDSVYVAQQEWDICTYIVECTCTIHIETSIHNTSGRAAIVENAILLCTTMKVSSLVDECKQTTLFLLLSRTVAVTKPCKCIRTYVHTMHTMCTHTPLSTHIHASRGWTSLYHLWK